MVDLSFGLFFILEKHMRNIILFPAVKKIALFLSLVHFSTIFQDYIMNYSFPYIIIIIIMSTWQVYSTVQIEK